MPTWSTWIHASRPKTLWASVAPVIVGTAVAWRDDQFYYPAALAALVGAILIQIGTNFANDLFDFERGADTEERTGPLRVTQAGLVSPDLMRRAMMTAFTLAFAVGVFLVWRGGWPVAGIGIASIVAAVCYTGGPVPYGYRGLGDVFVFVFFGPVAVAGTYYVQALHVTPTVWIVSVAMGALATAILVVNNYRDIETDRNAGKMTLAVRLGHRGSAWEYALLVAVAAAVPVVLVARSGGAYTTLIASAVVIPGLIYVRTLLQRPAPEKLNHLLAATARLQALYALVLSIGINL